jgi:hypothetical protein
VAKTDVTVELFYSGGWNELAAAYLGAVDSPTGVYARDPIVITRAKPISPDSQRRPPARLTLTLNNRDGQFSPRNPMSPLYGLVGRNTPILVTVDGDERFIGEVESWPQRWDTSGRDMWVPITAYGITHRLGAPGRAAPTVSALRRAILASETQPWAYWSLESDHTGDTDPGDELPSPIAGVAPMTQLAVGASFGKGSAGPGSAGVPDFRTGGTLDALIPDDGLFNAATGYTVEFVARFDNDSSPVGASAVMWFTPGSAGPVFWHLQAAPDMFLSFGGVPPASSQGSASAVVSAYDGLAHHYRVTVQQSGANIIVNLYRDGVLVDVGDDAGGPDPLVTGTVNRPTEFSVNRASISSPGAPSDENATGIGHITLWHGVTPPVDMPTAATGHVGETAAARMERLCEENGVEFTLIGDYADTETMGPQRVASLLDLMYDAADADGGPLYEPRDFLGLAYRTHTSLYNQDPGAELDYAAGGQVAPPLLPVEDLDGVANDITVTRVGGSSSRSVQETGPLNVAEPSDDPDGVGRIPKDLRLVVYADSQTQQQAAWIKHVRTWDEARYPIVKADVTAMEVEGDLDALIADVAALDMGDRLSITNLPSGQPQDSIEQLAQGFVETIETHRRIIEVAASPALPYDVFRLGTDPTDNLARIPAAAGETTLNEALDTTETGVDIVSTTVRWIDSATYPTQFPFDVMVGGERMRVTACTSTTLSQTFTVTRSINGIVKTHAAETPVQLFRPPVIAR